MSITATVEGLPELRAAFAAAHERIVVGLRGASLEAARAGVEEARANHPYTDRTTDLSQHAHAEQVEDNGSDSFNFGANSGALIAEMVWDEFYAGYVDEGTTRNRPYPFTPQAIRRATEVLEHETLEVVNAAVAAINSL